MKTDMGSVCTYVWQAKILVKILNYEKVDISWYAGIEFPFIFIL